MSYTFQYVKNVDLDMCLTILLHFHITVTQAHNECLYIIKSYVFAIDVFCTCMLIKHVRIWLVRLVCTCMRFIRIGVAMSSGCGDILYFLVFFLY